MNNRKALIAAVVFQLLVLVGMVAKAALPLWTGEEIRLSTQPVDPRSLFRGNYARLNYGISTIPSDKLLNRSTLRNGERVYVTLRPDEGGLHRFHSVALEPPVVGIYLSGRLDLSRGSWRADSYRVRYGIEAWFAPKDKAIALEVQLREGAIAVLKVAGNGAARLQAIEEKPEEEPAESDPLSNSAEQ